jgi:hypothetical protein
MSEGIAESTFGPLEVYPDDNPKTVLGLAKPRHSPFPPSALIHLGEAMENGRKKYGPDELAGEGGDSLDLCRRRRAASYGLARW